jgi:hypothetical protein
VFQDTFGLNVVQSPFPNKLLMSGFKGQAPNWTQTTWADGYAAYSLLYSNGPNNVQALAPGTDGQMHLGQTNLAPAWKTMSGDCTISAAGAITCTKVNGVSFPASGTSGGIPYYSSSSAISSSAALTANRIVLGGGAGVAPTVVGSLGTTTTLLHGNAAGAPTFSSVDLAADITGTLGVTNGGTGDTGTAWSTYTPTITASSGTFTTVSATGRSKTIGKTMFLEARVIITTVGTASGFVVLPMPSGTLAANAAATVWQENTNAPGGGFGTSGGSSFNLTKYDGTTLCSSGSVVTVTAVIELN